MTFPMTCLKLQTKLPAGNHATAVKQTATLFSKPEFLYMSGAVEFKENTASVCPNNKTL